MDLLSYARRLSCAFTLTTPASNKQECTTKTNMTIIK